MKRTLGATVVGLCVLVPTSSCGAAEPAEASPGSITVFAAASLKNTFTTLGEQFEADHPGADVTFSFAGSSDLVAQLIQGARADVFASADVVNMGKAVDADLVAGDPTNFASNTLAIVVEPGNPQGIGSFADLARSGLQVVVCAPQVPCGAAAQKVEEASGTQLRPVSEESSVADVLGKVTSGQADAGLVYVTDAVGAGDTVTTVAFPEASAAVNTYPIAVLADSANPPLAQEFLALVARAEGQAVLRAAGFAAP